MKKFLNIANSPKVDAGGYVNGMIEGMSLETIKVPQKLKNGDAKLIDVEQCVLNINVEGQAGAPIKIKHSCSTKLNGQKYTLKTDKKNEPAREVYNKLTKTCLQLKLLTEEELKNLNEKILERVMSALETLKNVSVRFKPLFDPETRLMSLNLDTLQKVDPQPGKKQGN